MRNRVDEGADRKVAENVKATVNHIENRQKIPSAAGLPGFREQHLPEGWGTKKTEHLITSMSFQDASCSSISTNTHLKPHHFRTNLELSGLSSSTPTAPSSPFAHCQASTASSSLIHTISAWLRFTKWLTEKSSYSFVPLNSRLLSQGEDICGIIMNFFGLGFFVFIKSYSF